MNKLQMFNYDGIHGVRTVAKNGQPYFVARDICEILEIGNVAMALDRLAPNMKGINTIDTPGGKQEMSVITEAGVYKLVFTSRKPEAEKFTDWIASEVLPSIRKHGMYAKEELLDNPDLLLDVITKLKQEREEKKLLMDKLEQQKPLVMFAETCIASNDSILVRELAKLASKNGVMIGEKRLYKKLREWGLILGKKNEPSQRAMDANWFEVKKGTYATPYGNEPFATTKVTPKGQIYIIERLRKEQREAV
jgi:anti-repressor protein